MNTVFSEKQFRNIYPDDIQHHFWNHARNSIILRFLRKSKLDKEEILEVGGGRGIVTRFLHNNHLKITGVELADVTPVKDVEAYFFTGTNALSLSESIRNRISVMLLLDVIEHIKAPQAFLEQLINAFPNIRHIVITVPARQELWTNFDEFNGHYMRYTINDLKCLKAVTFILRKAHYFNHLLYPVFRFFTGTGKQRSVEIRAPKGWQIVIHRLISCVLHLDYVIIPGKIRGTSCIALFSR